MKYLHKRIETGDQPSSSQAPTLQLQKEYRNLKSTAYMNIIDSRKLLKFEAHSLHGMRASDLASNSITSQFITLYTCWSSSSNTWIKFFHLLLLPVNIVAITIAITIIWFRQACLFPLPKDSSQRELSLAFRFSFGTLAFWCNYLR